MKRELAQVQNKRKAVILAILCFSTYTVSYIGRFNYAAALAEMTSMGVLSKTEGGRVATAYFFCYGIGQLINGILADRNVPTRQVAIGLLGSVFLNLMMSRAHSSSIMLLIWGANGYFQSMIWAPTFLIVSQSIPKVWRKKSLLLLNTAPSAGTIAAFAFSSLVLVKQPWQSVFSYASAFMGLFVVIWILVSLYVYKGATILTPSQMNISKKERAMACKRDDFLRILVFSGGLFLILPALLHGMLKDGITTWLPTYLTEVFTIPTQIAVGISIFLPIINMLGATIAYWMMIKIKNEIFGILLMFGAAGICLLPLWLWGKASPVLTILLFALVTAAMMAANVIFCTAVPLRFAYLGKVATVSGFYNFCGYIGTSASMFAVAYISERFGWSMSQLLWIGSCIVAIVCCVVALPSWHVFLQTNYSTEKNTPP